MKTLNRMAGVIIVVAAFWWWAVFVAMHVLEPEFNPLKAPGSAYVLGPYGAWARTSYFALSAMLISAGIGLAADLEKTTLTRAALSAFLVAATGSVLAGLFAMDFPGPPRTLSGWLHAIGGLLAFFPWPLGTLLFSLSIRRDHRWRERARTLFTLSLLSIGVMVVLQLSIILLGFGGYAQRLLLALLFAWTIIAGLHLRLSPAAGIQAAAVLK